MTDILEEKAFLNEQFEGLINSLNNIKNQMTVLQQQIRTVEKNVKKEYKVLHKDLKKGKSKGNKNPSGFAKPTKVTNDLCKFMNKEEGSEIARTDVTKALISYIDDNNLKDSENKKIIIPDDKLKTLLGLEEKDVTLTYFNIQKYMNRHFLKSVQPNKEVVQVN